MLNLFLSNLIVFGLQSNVVTNSGAGILLYSREKKYRLFRYIDTLFLMLVIAICAVATYFLNMFVYTKFDLVEIKVCVVVIFAACLHLLVCALWKKISKFNHYLYENSCSYVFDLVFTIYVVMIFDLTLEIVPFLISVASSLVVIFAMNLFLGFFLEGINKSDLNVNFRNVSARLFLFAIFAMILYYASMLV